ncbi:MAG: hypothetical protein WDW38_011446 [Sanguina aurantia]
MRCLSAPHATPRTSISTHLPPSHHHHHHHHHPTTTTTTTLPTNLPRLPASSPFSPLPSSGSGGGAFTPIVSPSSARPACLNHQHPPTTPHHTSRHIPRVPQTARQPASPYHPPPPASPPTHRHKHHTHHHRSGNRTQGLNGRLGPSGRLDTSRVVNPSSPPQSPPSAAAAAAAVPAAAAAAAGGLPPAPLLLPGRWAASNHGLLSPSGAAQAKAAPLLAASHGFAAASAEEAAWQTGWVGASGSGTARDRQSHATQSWYQQGQGPDHLLQINLPHHHDENQQQQQLMTMTHPPRNLPSPQDPDRHGRRLHRGGEEDGGRMLSLSPPRRLQHNNRVQQQQQQQQRRHSTGVHPGMGLSSSSSSGGGSGRVGFVSEEGSRGEGSGRGGAGAEDGELDPGFEGVRHEMGGQRAAEEYAASLPSGLMNVSLSATSLSHLPSTLKRLLYLESLAASFNSLGDIAPHHLQALSHNLKLHLGSNSLLQLPDSVGQMQQLKMLAVSSNRLTALPDPLCRCLKLQAPWRSLLARQSGPGNGAQIHSELRTVHCCLLRAWPGAFPAAPYFLPPSLALLLAPEEALFADHNSLSRLPSNLGHLPSLQALHLSHNTLTSLPPSLLAATQLTALSLAHNSLGGLSSLELLDLKSNRLGASELLTPLEPEGCSSIAVAQSHLQHLDLSGNDLDQFPTWIPSGIQHLDLSNNRLTDFPPWLFQRLLSLRHLVLHNNGLRLLPKSLTQLSTLQRISLSHNPVSSPVSNPVSSPVSNPVSSPATNHTTHGAAWADEWLFKRKIRSRPEVARSMET